MATILNDREIDKLIGIIIIDGDRTCIKPHSYIIRLGESGEFLNSSKEFTLGKKKKGIRIQPGHSVALTAYETLDFRRETVHKIFPGHDLHGLISPTTDLSREGIVASTTQVDAGYHGTLNWTLTNTSSQERRFVFQEKIFRLTIFKLEEGETADQIYSGEYQGKTGYVRSQRSGAPVGMKESEWEDSLIKGGPEEILDNLIKSGYPWHILGERLKVIDLQFKSVTDEYASISDAIDKLTSEVDLIRKDSTEFVAKIHTEVREALKESASMLQNRWIIGSGSIIAAFVGLALSITSNETAFSFVKEYGVWLGLLIIIIGISFLIIISKKDK